MYPGEVRVFILQASARLGLGDVKASIHALDCLPKNSEQWYRWIPNKLENSYVMGKVVHLCRV